MELTVLTRLDELERSNRRLRSWLVSCILLLAVGFGLSLMGFTRASTASVSADSLRVRELIVVDSQGVVRVRLGVHLPDAMINGRRLPRGEDASGILLYDDSGRERGGYVTFAPSGNVALTLDTREKQAALFAAGPDGGATARLWGGAGWVEMRADETGPRVSAGRAGEVVFAQPAWSDADEAAGCSELKTELKDVQPAPPADQVLAACKARMPDAVCRKCLGTPFRRP